MSRFPRTAVHRHVAAATLLLAVTTVQCAPAQTWRNVSSARQLAGEQSLDVNIEYGAGNLRLSPASGSFLYQMEARYDADRFTPVTEYDAAGRQLRLGFKGNGRIRDAKGGRLSLGLSRDLPVALKLEFGAGEADLDFGDLSLRSVDLATGASETRISWDRPNRTPAEHVKFAAGAASLRATGLGNARAARYSFEGGVGETTLDFSGAWTRNATASINLGVGSVTLRFPRSLGVHINKDSFLTSFDAAGMTKRGKSFYSRNWETAEHRLTLDVDAALGSIQVEWVDG